MKSAIIAAAIIGASFFGISSSSLHAEGVPPAPVQLQVDSSAHPKGTINGRQRRQQKRIKEGVKDGDLTAKETLRLEKGEAKINADEAAARADGTVTPKERAKINRELNRQSHAIHHQKHDKQEPGAGS